MNEARDDEREALDAVMDAHAPVWRNGWHGCKCGREWPEHRYNPPAFIAAVEAHRREEILAAGYRTYPEPEITDERCIAIDADLRATSWPVPVVGGSEWPSIIRAVLESAARVPVGEREQ